MLEPLVSIESSQDKGNIPVRSSRQENYPEWKPALRAYMSRASPPDNNRADLFDYDLAVALKLA